MESWEKEFLDYVFGNKDKSTICSTCKHFDGKKCAENSLSAGVAIKLSDCNDKWEACNG